MSKKVYCVLVIGHTEDEVLAYNVSQEAYETLDEARAFIRSRSGEMAEKDDDNYWVATKAIADQPEFWFEYRIRELEIKEHTKKCPNCGQEYKGHPALSREDNKTEICPACGTREAMQAFMKEKGVEADA